MFRSCLGLLLLIESTQSGNDTNDVRGVYRRLREDLFKNYDRHVRPVLYNSNVTQVQVEMHLVSTFEIDEEARTIDIDSYMSMQWTDSHLHWESENYDYIRIIQVSPNDVWLPDIYEMQRGGPTSDIQKSDFNFVMVEEHGRVHWYFATVLPGRCTFDYHNYPTDIIECKIRLEAWSFTGNALDFDVMIWNYKKKHTFPKPVNNQWDITDIAAARSVMKTNLNVFPSAEYTITLKRKTPTLQQQLIWIASVIVVILTLGMFWIPADIEQKVTVGCIMMVIMTAVLLTVASSIRPREPVILIADTIHNIMYVITAAILLEIIAINLQHIQEWKPPEFLLNIFSGTVGKLLLISSAQQEKPSLDKMKLSEYENADVMLEQLITKGNWKTISQALDRVAFLMYIIILSAMPKTP